MIQLSITYESTTLDFQDNGYVVLDGYYPRPPSGDGSPVTDEIELRINASSEASRLSMIQAVNRALEHARNHRSGPDGAYLKFAISETATAWRTRILDGLVTFGSQLDRDWRRGYARCTLYLEREPFWEGPEAQLALTNGNGTDVLTALRVYNCSDGSGTSPNKRHNYVDVDGADIDGDLPAACRIEMIHDSVPTSGRGVGDVWIGVNFTNPSTHGHILEAESAIGATPTADSNASGGYYDDYTVSAADTEYDMFKWTLSSGALDAAAGRYFKVLARFHSSSGITVLWYRIKLESAGLLLYQSGQIKPSADYAQLLRDLGTFQLPPRLASQTSIKAMTLTLTGEASSAPQTINLDFLQLTPVDQYRLLKRAGNSPIVTERLIDDGINDELYIDNGAGLNKLASFVGYGPAIRLYPGKDHRIHFLYHTDYANECYINQTLTVKLYYRPRRASF